MAYHAYDFVIYVTTDDFFMYTVYDNCSGYFLMYIGILDIVHRLNERNDIHLHRYSSTVHILTELQDAIIQHFNFAIPSKKFIGNLRAHSSPQLLYVYVLTGSESEQS